MKDLELIDKEFITDQFDTYESDLVYKVNTKKGIIYLFFLFELQGYNDFTMPFRLLVYMIAIWLDYFKNCDKDVRKKKGYRLELQSYNDFTMPLRLLVYITAILLDYFKNCDKVACRKQAFRLLAVIPIVLHNGERSRTAFRHFKEVIDKAELFGDHIIDFEYVLVSIKNPSVICAWICYGGRICISNCALSW